MTGMTDLSPKRALVLFSGGQDSTTALAYALAHYDAVETIGFDYGQRHQVELTCRGAVLAEIKQHFPEWGAKLGPDRVINLATFSQLSPSALTDEQAEITTGPSGLPTSFVPGRNLFFFQYAAVLAFHRNLGHLVGGMCETDYSGYPDCREATLQSLNRSLNLGMATDFEIVTPLMHLTKAESWHLAFELGGAAFVTLIRDATHTCYKGVRAHLHEWGYGCGACPACELRRAGYEEWQATLDAK